PASARGSLPSAGRASSSDSRPEPECGRRAVAILVWTLVGKSGRWPVGCPPWLRRNRPGSNFRRRRPPRPERSGREGKVGRPEASPPNDRKRRAGRPRLAAGQLCEGRAEVRRDTQELAADEDRIDAGPLERDDLLAVDRPAGPSDDELSRGHIGQEVEHMPALLLEARASARRHAALRRR